MITRFRCSVCSEIKVEIWLLCDDFEHGVCKECRDEDEEDIRDADTVLDRIQKGEKTISHEEILERHITCEYCTRDLINTMRGGYRIKLSSEYISDSVACTMGLLFEDPLPEPMTFCGFGCLHHWLHFMLLKEPDPKACPDSP